MSVSRKPLTRKHFIEKLEQLKYDWQGQPLRLTFGQNLNKTHSSHPRKSKQKNRQNTLITTTQTSNNKPIKHPNPLHRSKQSKESKQSLSKSTNNYYLNKGKGKHSRSVTDKHLRRHKSKELTTIPNGVNVTFETQTALSSHKKQQSNFSSTMVSKVQVHSNIKAVEYSQRTKVNDQLKMLVFKSEQVLQKYKSKNDTLQQQNRFYKQKYQQALKKIRYLQSRQ